MKLSAGTYLYAQVALEGSRATWGFLGAIWIRKLTHSQVNHIIELLHPVEYCIQQFLT